MFLDGKMTITMTMKTTLTTTIINRTTRTKKTITNNETLSQTSTITMGTLTCIINITHMMITQWPTKMSGVSGKMTFTTVIVSATSQDLKAMRKNFLAISISRITTRITKPTIIESLIIIMTTMNMDDIITIITGQTTIIR